MYAIIKSGGKQLRVTVGDIVDVELLGADEGADVEFKEVLFLNNGEVSMFGAPLVEGCIVKGKMLGVAKGPKVIAFKFKKRKNYHRKIGHRQKYARIEITEINNGS